MMMRKVYLKSFSRISVCHPDPDFKSMFSMMEARRMSLLMKRASAVSQDALSKAGLTVPDAVITGTGYGCIENTEAFLKALKGVSGQPLRPTHFMQSTHNTVSSLVAIRLGCHGYNATYSHSTVSFESALLDAFIQIGLGYIDNALVGAFEESTPDFCRILEKAGNGHTMVDGQMSFTAASFVLGFTPDNAVCCISDIDIVRNAPALTAGIDADRVISRADCIRKYGDNLCVSALGACDAVSLVSSGECSTVILDNESEGHPSASIIFSAVC